MRSLNAEYRDGLLKPDKPLDLAQGHRAAIIVVKQGAVEGWDAPRLAASGDEDQALAEQGLDDWADTLDAEDRA
jgi:predicted DNA-binding antitoxin AbrB/MazE fold protein